MGNISTPNTPSNVFIPPALRETPPEEVIEQPKQAIVNSKQDTRLSLKEKWNLFIILILAVCIPVFCTFLITKHHYTAKFTQYESQLITIQTELESFKKTPHTTNIDKIINILDEKISAYNTEIQELTNNPVYIATNKKIKELDNKIIKCNVHKKNIESNEEIKNKEFNKLIEEINNIN